MNFATRLCIMLSVLWIAFCWFGEGRYIIDPPPASTSAQGLHDFLMMGLFGIGIIWTVVIGARWLIYGSNRVKG